MSKWMCIHVPGVEDIGVDVNMSWGGGGGVDMNMFWGGLM